MHFDLNLTKITHKNKIMVFHGLHFFFIIIISVYIGVLHLLLPKSRNVSKSFTSAMAQIHRDCYIPSCSVHITYWFCWTFSVSESKTPTRGTHCQFHCSLALPICFLCLSLCHPLQTLLEFRNKQCYIFIP